MLTTKIFSHTPVLGLSDLFTQAQLFENTHPGVRKQLYDLFMKKPRDVFIMEFIQCFSAVLAHPVMGGPKMDKMLKFVAVFFATYENDVEDVVHAVLKFIFQHHNRESPFIRFHCCRFITFFLNNLGESASVDDRVFSQISATMGKRLNDKNTRIRCEAVAALKRLQTPADEKCHVMKAYIFYLDRDPNAEVRIAILKNLVLTPKTLPHIIGRISDINGAVKLEAYKSLAVLNARKISIKFRQKILTYGMNDECANVKEYVTSRLIPSWYESVSEDFIVFLRLLHVENFDSDILKNVLFSLFAEESTETLIEKVSSFQRNKLIPIDDLSAENVTFWYFVLNYLRQPKLEIDEDEIFKIVPELSRFTVYVQTVFSKFVENQEGMQYVLIQLFKIACLYNMDDQVGREKLRDLCCSLLTDKSVTLKCIPDIVKNLEKAVPTTEILHNLVAEIVSEIREPLSADSEPDVELPGPAESEVSVLENSHQNLIGCTDPETVTKCLTIVLNVMKSKAIGKISETLLSLKDNFVMKCFEIENELVQSLAQEVITIFCIWDVTIAKDNILKFFFLVASDETRVPALKSLFDNLLAHGLNSFESKFSLARHPRGGDILDDYGGPEWRNDTTLSPALRALFHDLTGLLDSHDPEVRSIVSQGLAKLFLSGFVESPVVFAKLTAFWFNPSAAKGHDMRQPLGLFYHWFSTKSCKAGPIIVDSFLLTVKFVENYNSKNVENEIDVMSVATALIDLISPDNCVPSTDKTGSYHMQLAFILTRHLVRVCNYSVLTRALNYLVFPLEDGFRFNELLNLLKPVVKRLGTFRDKRLLKTIMTFKSRVEERRAKYIEDHGEDVDSQVDQMDCSAAQMPENVDNIRESVERMEDNNEGLEDRVERQAEHIEITESPVGNEEECAEREEELIESVESPVHIEERVERQGQLEEIVEETIEEDPLEQENESESAKNNTVVDETLNDESSESSLDKDSLTETSAVTQSSSLTSSDKCSPMSTRSRRKL